MALPIGFTSHSSLDTILTSDDLHSTLRPSSSHALEGPVKSSRRFIPSLRFSQLLNPQLLESLSDQPLSLPPKSPIPSPRKRARAKHIPIVIPDFAYPILPEGPLTPKSEREPSISDFPLPSTVTQPLPIPAAKSRPRHVEIKIPEFIASRYLPPTPRSVDFSKSSSDTSSEHSIRDPDKASALVVASEDGKNFAEFIENCLWSKDKDRKDSAVSLRGMANPLRVNTRVGTLNSNTAVDPSPTVFRSMNGGLTGSAGGRTVPGGLPFRLNTQDATPDTTPVFTPGSNAAVSAGPSPAVAQGPGGGQTTSSNLGLSGFVCNVHRTTGREPKPLVGATTTIAGDKLYVFGGRRLSRTKTQLTADLYELDLVQRHWTKIESRGDIPPPRYFHSVCALGDTKLVCYGGMSPSSLVNGKPPQGTGQDGQLEMGVLSDIHIYDIPTKSWMKVSATNAPQGRYAHCATILPSSAIFSSTKATLSAIQHNPSSPDTPNQGKLGVSLDGTGGAEMIVVGGQDAENHYIEQISVFNLRSLAWTSTSPLGRACGAYRSVTAPLSATVASQIGIGPPDKDANGGRTDSPPDAGGAMLIYSNYNFLDVRLELQIHLSDGTLIEKAMQTGDASPPGLRFPNGGVIDNHFVVSGTFLTSYKQEYALWALDLRTLVWNRIDIGSSTFSQGSWNRGVLWSRRNSFVILGNRKRSLVEDYNHRRVNFSNMCVVELEAFGLYENPRRITPRSGFVSASSPPSSGNGLNSESTRTASAVSSSLDRTYDNSAGGRELSRAGEELGLMIQAASELADMELLAINGERIPANSRLISRRWGSYFNKIMRDALVAAQGDDTATLRPSMRSTAQGSRNSSVTITPSVSSAAPGVGRDSTATTAVGTNPRTSDSPYLELHVNPAERPRILFLPHTPQTIQALLHYFYTSSLPPPSSHLCSPQILCSLLQIARPYKIDGLLEAVVERLHGALDPRNTAAIFNAAAMAAGGGSAVEFAEEDYEVDKKKGGLTGGGLLRSESPGQAGMRSGERQGQSAAGPFGSRFHGSSSTSLTRDDEEGQRPGTASSQSGADTASEDDAPGSATRRLEVVWDGSLSAVVGLQKRGLRGLMEGRRIREMGSRDTAVGAGNAAAGDQVGLGIGRS